MKKFYLPILFLLFSQSAQATNPPRIEASLLSEASTIKPGDTFKIGIELKIEPGWHIYWKKSGDAGLPTSIQLEVPKGLKISSWGWPKPSIFQEGGNILTIGYKGTALFIADAVLPGQWPQGKPVEIKGRVEWLACRNSCIPGKSLIQLSIQTGQENIPNIEQNKIIQEESPFILNAVQEKLVEDEYQRQKSQIDFLSEIGASSSRESLGPWLALIFAFLGGILLNFMPCVLPVLSIKALRFIRQRDSSRHQNMKHSLLYLAGVLGSFTALGVVVMSIKLAGQEIGWGFQFQEPRFIIFMTAVVFTFGISLLGFYEFSLTLPQNMENITREESWVGPFGEGLLATILATPCTAPFLGPAIGFSFSQSPFIILCFFWLIGVGLASPYLLLAAFPAWTKILPKGGPWMETFKKLMAVPLFGTGIWLLWILSRQVAYQAILGTIFVLIAIGVGVWAMSKWAGFGEPVWKRRVMGTTSFILIIATYLLFVEPYLKSFSFHRPNEIDKSKARTELIDWHPFSTPDLISALGKKKLVFIDFSADWCLTCKVNERVVLNSKKVAQAFKENDVWAFKADWTNRDEEITKVIRRLGRSGVPVYVFFLNGDVSNPLILPEILTEKILLNKLSEVVNLGMNTNHWRN